MKYFCLLIILLYTSEASSQRLDFQGDLVFNTQKKRLYTRSDSVLNYCFRIIFNDKNDLLSVQTYYFASNGEIKSFIDKNTFKRYNYKNIEGLLPKQQSSKVFILSFINKNVEEVKDYRNNLHFSSVNFEQVLKLMSVAINQNKSKSYILKPLIVFTENAL